MKRWSLTLLLLFAGPLLAEEEAWRSPEQVPGAVTISAQQAKALFDEGVAFVDVRNPRLYARRHVPGANHLDLNAGFTREAFAAVAATAEPVVIYCSGVKCSRSYRACEQAVSWGYEKVYYFRGGIVEWRDAGFPMESTE